MKNFLIFLVLALSFIVSGCTSKNPENITDDIVYSVPVSLILPYKFIDDIDENNLDKYIKSFESQDGVYEISYTDSEFLITLSEEKLEEFKEDFFTKLSDYIKSVLSDLVVNISYSQDVSEYIIFVNSDIMLDNFEEIAFTLMKKGSLYQALLGKDPENTNVVVNILNEKNTVVLERFNSLDYYNMLTDIHEDEEEHTH